MSRNTYIIAECGINGNGDLNITKQLIDVAVDAGCDAVKFQKRTIDAVYTKEDLDRPRESPWGTTNREQKLGLEFNVDEYAEIDAYCKSKGIDWFVSCWDEESIDFIEQFNTPFHKVASAMLTDKAFLTKLAKTGKPLLLSTGMSTSEQIVDAMEHIKSVGGLIGCVMHCTSTYPTLPEEMNISGMAHLKSLMRQSFPNDTPRLGFSNHYSGLVWAPVAVALGAEVIEFHITLDRTMYGSDQAASIEPDGVRRIVEHVEVTERMMGDGTKRVYDSELPIIDKLRNVK